MKNANVITIRVGTLQAHYRLQGDADVDSANLYTIAAQLRHYRRTGLFVPAMSSEPSLTEVGIVVTRNGRRVR